MVLRFLDTKVILRHLLRDHAEQSPKATAYLQLIEDGREQARITDIIVFEIVFTLQRQYHFPKAVIREGVHALIELPGIVRPASAASARRSICTSSATSRSRTPITR